MFRFLQYYRRFLNFQISPFLFRPALRATFPPGEGSGCAAETLFFDSLNRQHPLVLPVVFVDILHFVFIPAHVNKIARSNIRACFLLSSFRRFPLGQFTHEGGDLLGGFLESVADPGTDQMR